MAQQLFERDVAPRPGVHRYGAQIGEGLHPDLGEPADGDLGHLGEGVVQPQRQCLVGVGRASGEEPLIRTLAHALIGGHHVPGDGHRGGGRTPVELDEERGVAALGDLGEDHSRGTGSESRGGGGVGRFTGDRHREGELGTSRFDRGDSQVGVACRAGLGPGAVPDGGLDRGADPRTVDHHPGEWLRQRIGSGKQRRGHCSHSEDQERGAVSHDDRLPRVVNARAARSTAHNPEPTASRRRPE